MPVRRFYLFSVTGWVLLFLALDQLSKYWVMRLLPEGQAWPLLPFLSFYRTRNTGIAFSMLSSVSGIGLIILTIAIILFIAYLLWRQNPRRHLTCFGYILIIGGALGNVTDRLRLHYVVDFILFHLGSWSFAVFNLADSFITIGAICIFLGEFLKFPAKNSSGSVH